MHHFQDKVSLLDFLSSALRELIAFSIFYFWTFILMEQVLMKYTFENAHIFLV